MVLNKRSLILTICLLFLVVFLPNQISASDTTLSIEDSCTKSDKICVQDPNPVIRFECRNNDTWRITIWTTRCTDGSIYTQIIEDPYLFGQCPYGGLTY